MGTVIIIREEIICLFILIILLMNYLVFMKQLANRKFLRLEAYALLHVFLDIITVYSVNHAYMISESANMVMHTLFFVSALMFCREYICYVFYLCLTKKVFHILKRVSAGIIGIFCIVDALMYSRNGFEYHIGQYTNYSTGINVFLCYGIVFLFFISSYVVIFCNMKRIDEHVKYMLLIMSVILTISSLLQLFYGEILCSGATATVITITVYFSLENPAKLMKDRAYIDFDTGVKNKNCYEEDMKRIDVRYFQKKSYNQTVSIVIGDLNCLKMVNDQYGHLEGDKIIQKTAYLLSKNLKQAKNIYRIGGDEFIAVYIGTNPMFIQKDMEAVWKACSEIKAMTPIQLALGYAQSNENTVSVYDVIQEADKEMYKRKEAMKQNLYCE